jgi:hypothetical protein
VVKGSDDGAVRYEMLSLLRSATRVDPQGEGASLVEPQWVNAVDHDATAKVRSEPINGLFMCGPWNGDDHYLSGTGFLVGQTTEVSVEICGCLFSTRSVTRADPHVMAGDRQAPGESASQRTRSTHDPDRP